ncbi:transcriptional regulator domain-containing protein [Brevundimonas aurifodinae]|uniref:transcriptional regulator domain-containing protein n=1 Tax=Brevundimonas aurifodinae TaxID=1508312 RepID=UPI003D80FD9E
MSTKRDWRDPAPYELIETLSPSDIAWEFLRRDPAYQRDFRAGLKTTPEQADQAAGHWGLRFRSGPAAECRPG